MLLFAGYYCGSIPIITDNQPAGPDPDSPGGKPGLRADLCNRYRASEVSWQSTLTLGVLGLGYTLTFSDGYSISYAVRGHTSELKQGNGNRTVVWGGLLLSKTIG